jgi:hypothetical protein
MLVKKYTKGVYQLHRANIMMSRSNPLNKCGLCSSRKALMGCPFKSLGDQYINTQEGRTFYQIIEPDLKARFSVHEKKKICNSSQQTTRKSFQWREEYRKSLSSPPFSVLLTLNPQYGHRRILRLGGKKYRQLSTSMHGFLFRGIYCPTPDTLQKYFIRGANRHKTSLSVA